MTPAQDAAYRQVKDIATEHFDGFLFVCQATLEGKTEDDTCTETRITYDGGANLARGLAMYAIQKFRPDRHLEPWENA